MLRYDAKVEQVFNDAQSASQSNQTTGYQVLKHNIPEVWQESAGQGVTVCVIDTGCHVKHNDLKDVIPASRNLTIDRSPVKHLTELHTAVRQLPMHPRPKRLVRNLLNKKRQEIWGEVDDGNGHGTHVTGIIAAQNNAHGIVGIAPAAKVIVVKALDDNGSGSYHNIAQAIAWARRQKADIINMSLGGYHNDPALRYQIKRAYAENIPVICAAGNDGDQSKLIYPARYSETISIGALDENNDRAWWSQTGPNLDFVAPGVSILSTYPKNRYASMSGTSMATPWVAGVVALMISKHRLHGGNTPINTVEDVREHLKKTSIDLNQAGRDAETGFGLIDVKRMLDSL